MPRCLLLTQSGHRTPAFADMHNAAHKFLGRRNATTAHRAYVGYFAMPRFNFASRL